ncbi:MAG TPA: hypothetical protein VHE81_21780 [Lacipirellulaceae bacterium]|nr:hypothetical protein [Lacipirellulaceae bacterium]
MIKENVKELLELTQANEVTLTATKSEQNGVQLEMAFGTSSIGVEATKHANASKRQVASPDVAAFVDSGRIELISGHLELQQNPRVVVTAHDGAKTELAITDGGIHHFVRQVGLVEDLEVRIWQNQDSAQSVGSARKKILGKTTMQRILRSWKPDTRLKIQELLPLDAGKSEIQ